MYMCWLPGKILMPNYGNKQLTDQNHTKFVITQSNKQTNKNDTCPVNFIVLQKF